MGFCLVPDVEQLNKDITRAANSDEVQAGALEKLQSAVDRLNDKLNMAGTCDPVEFAKEIIDKLDPSIKSGPHHNLGAFMQWDSENNRWGAGISVFDKNPQHYILRGGKPVPVEIDQQK